MRINGDNRLNGPAPARSRASDTGTDNVFRLDEGGEARDNKAAGATPALGGVEALLTLQSVGPVPDAGARLRHGHDMLDLLDDLRIGLLGGAFPADKLERLVDNLARRPARIEGEQVEQVLDEIELRARVELAKLGREAA